MNAYKAGGSRFDQWARAQLGGLSLVDWSWGRIAMTWEIDDRYIMPDGVMFGGFVACVGDHLAGLTTMTVLEAKDDRFRTARLETTFFRPMMKPRARIEGRVVNASKSLIHVEADIFNAEEKLAVRIAATQMRRKEAIKD